MEVVTNGLHGTLQPRDGLRIQLIDGAIELLSDLQRSN